MFKKWFALGGAIGVMLSVAYIVATPYITLQQMKSAMDDQDSETLSEYIDFSRVRASLKEQINAMFAEEMAKKGMRDSPYAAFGAALAVAMTDKMVEVYVSPTGLRQMMAGQAPKAPARPAGTDESQEASRQKEPLENITTAYDGINRFVVTVKAENGKSILLVLHRDGLGWKVTDIVLPKVS